jgi:hypothetical protein
LLSRIAMFPFKILQGADPGATTPEANLKALSDGFRALLRRGPEEGVIQ